MSIRCLALLAGALVVLFAGVVPASEPHGYAIVSFEWIEDSQHIVGPQERVLRLAVRPAVSIRSARLGPDAPELITLTIPSGDSGSGGAPRYEIESGSDGKPLIVLGDLERDQIKVLDLLVHAPVGKAGVAVFTVSGEVAPGRTFEEKWSWTVGSPTGAVLRHGAAEYPARIVPENPP